MEKNRCKKYEGKDTFGLGKNYVYKKCKRCPSTKAFDPSSNYGRPDVRTVYDACLDEKIYLRGLKVTEERKKQKKDKKTKRKKKKRTKRIKKGGSSCPERPYLSDPLKEGVIAPEGKLLRTLNPPLQMVLPNAKRFQNTVKHHGQDCLCGLELNRVMDNIDEKWSRILMIEQEKNEHLEDRLYQLEKENEIYKKNYIRMTPEMMADPLFLHGDQQEQIPHSVSGSSKRRRSSRRSSGSC